MEAQARTTGRPGALAAAWAIKAETAATPAPSKEVTEGA